MISINNLDKNILLWHMSVYFYVLKLDENECWLFFIPFNEMKYKNKNGNEYLIIRLTWTTATAAHTHKLTMALFDYSIGLINETNCKVQHSPVLNQWTSVTVIFLAYSYHSKPCTVKFSCSSVHNGNSLYTCTLHTPKGGQTLVEFDSIGTRICFLQMACIRYGPSCAPG